MAQEEREVELWEEQEERWGRAWDWIWDAGNGDGCGCAGVDACSCSDAFEGREE